MPVIDKLFTEIFRAKSLDKLVLPVRITSELSKGLIQNIMLYGPQGCGKTTIAKILVDGHDTLKLNGSTENGIDVIRNQVVTFASSISLDKGKEKFKVIFIDEADGLSDNAWDGLRETIEHYSTSVRFVCTCNKIDKIPAPIQSRFNRIPVYPINKEEEQAMFIGYCSYVGQILTKLNIKHDDATLSQFVKNSFPDMRSLLNSIQKLYTQDATELDKNSLVQTFDCSDLFDLIVNGGVPEDNYKFIMTNYSSNPDDAMLEISKSFVDFIRTSYPQYNAKIPYIIIETAEYMHQLSTAIDRVIVLLACCFKLQMIIKQ